jgi:hypothetical protein
LDRDANPVQIATPESVLDGRSNSEPHASGGDWRRVAAATARATQHIGGLGARPVHVGRTRADVLTGVVAAAEAFDRTAERAKQRLRFVFPRIADDHGLAATERQAGHSRLIGHALGQPQDVRERFSLARVGPHATTAERRAEARVVQGDDGLQAARRIEQEDHLLMFVEGRRCEHVHFALRGASCAARTDLPGNRLQTSIGPSASPLCMCKRLRNIQLESLFMTSR